MTTKDDFTPRPTPDASPEAEGPPRWNIRQGIWAQWGQTGTDWETALVGAAEQTMLERLNRAWEAWQAILEPSQERMPFETFSSLDTGSSDLFTEAITAGAAAGYALARTWPGELRDIENWPSRARAFLGLPEVDRG